MLYPWQIVTRSMGIGLAGQLPLKPDPNLLRSDLEAVQAKVKVPSHKSVLLRDGDLNTIGLVTAGGLVNENRPVAGSRYEKTEALAYCPHIESFLDGLGIETERVRLLSLAPDRRIFWHCDPLNSMDGHPGGRVARVHVPIITNPRAQIQISHETYCWRPGEVWWADFSFPHRVANDWDQARVHLVMDLVVNDAFMRLLPDWFWEQRAVRVKARRYATRLCSTWYFYRRDYRSATLKRLKCHLKDAANARTKRAAG